jgi:predicted O-methyltransferase YrrM
MARFSRKLLRIDEYPRGHFYSPLPGAEEMARARARTRSEPGSLGDLRVDPAPQMETLKAALAADDACDPFAGPRYSPNRLFNVTDARVLGAFIRRFRPAQIIEIGSGYSSAVMLDCLSRGGIPFPRLTLIEPHPARLLALLRPEDRPRLALHEKMVQDVPLDLFEALGPGDLLFVDSSHVSKYGSDLNHVFFEILPRLPAGVFVHFHDVHWPFEYPADWLDRGWAWNEAYLLRAFLQFNDSWAVRLWPSQLLSWRPEEVEALLPTIQRAPGGSIYLEKVR